MFIMCGRKNKTQIDNTGSHGKQLSIIAAGQSNRHDIAERHEELLWKNIPNTKDEVRLEEAGSGNQQQLKLIYLFRKPKYPLLCNIDGFMFAARSEKKLRKNLALAPVDPEKMYDVIDATVEGWSFMPKYLTISPLTLKKGWTKKEIIALYNVRTNKIEGATAYSEKSLSSKRLEKVFEDIVELLLASK